MTLLCHSTTRANTTLPNHLSGISFEELTLSVFHLTHVGHLVRPYGACLETITRHFSFAIVIKKQRNKHLTNLFFSSYFSEQVFLHISQTWIFILNSSSSSSVTSISGRIGLSPYHPHLMPPRHANHHFPSSSFAAFLYSRCLPAKKISAFLFQFILLHSFSSVACEETFLVNYLGALIVQFRSGA